MTILWTEIPLWVLIVSGALSGLLLACNVICSYQERKEKYPPTVGEVLFFVPLNPVVMAFTPISGYVATQKPLLGLACLAVMLIALYGLIGLAERLFGDLWRQRSEMARVDREREWKAQIGEIEADNRRRQEQWEREEMERKEAEIRRHEEPLQQHKDKYIQQLRDEGVEPDLIAGEEERMQDIIREMIHRSFGCYPDVPVVSKEEREEISRWMVDQLEQLYDLNMDPAQKNAERIRIRQEAHRRRRTPLGEKS